MGQRPEKMIKPIAPEEVAEVKKMAIPDSMIEAANQLIIDHWNGHSAVFKLKELLIAYRKLAGSGAVCERKLIEYNWLNIEPIFIEVGWKVKYESPLPDESFEEYFEFRKK